MALLPVSSPSTPFEKFQVFVGLQDGERIQATPSGDTYCKSYAASGLHWLGRYRVSADTPEAIERFETHFTQATYELQSLLKTYPSLQEREFEGMLEVSKGMLYLSTTHLKSLRDLDETAADFLWGQAAKRIHSLFEKVIADYIDQCIPLPMRDFAKEFRFFASLDGGQKVEAGVGTPKYWKSPGSRNQGRFGKRIQDSLRYLRGGDTPDAVAQFKAHLGALLRNFKAKLEELGPLSSRSGCTRICEEASRARCGLLTLRNTHVPIDRIGFNQIPAADDMSKFLQNIANIDTYWAMILDEAATYYDQELAPLVQQYYTAPEIRDEEFLMLYTEDELKAQLSAKEQELSQKERLLRELEQKMKEIEQAKAAAPALSATSPALDALPMPEREAAAPVLKKRVEKKRTPENYTLPPLHPSSKMDPNPLTVEMNKKYDPQLRQQNLEALLQARLELGHLEEELDQLDAECTRRFPKKEAPSPAVIPIGGPPVPPPPPPPPRMQRLPAPLPEPISLDEQKEFVHEFYDRYKELEKKHHDNRLFIKRLLFSNEQEVVEEKDLSAYMDRFVELSKSDIVELEKIASTVKAVKATRIEKKENPCTEFEDALSKYRKLEGEAAALKKKNYEPAVALRRIQKELARLKTDFLSTRTGRDEIQKAIDTKQAEYESIERQYKDREKAIEKKEGEMDKLRNSLCWFVGESIDNFNELELRVKQRILRIESGEETFSKTKPIAKSKPEDLSSSVLLEAAENNL